MAREVPSSEFPSLTAKLDPKTWYMIYPILKFETTGLNSGTHVKLYEYKEDDKLFYLALKYHKFEKLIVVGNTNFEDEEFDGRAMAALCSLIYEKLAAEELFETVLSGAADREVGFWKK
uniref:N-acetyltransferase domain-containing protein n=1 Tax=Panagrolaimus sp. JU765 TaxID=591449 RepID=A0AC34QIH4_9BILA